MQDIKIDNDFNVVFNRDLKLISDIEVQRQRLYSYFSIKKGDLFWAKDFGFNSSFFLKLIKLNNTEGMKSYLFEVVRDLGIDLMDISIKVEKDNFLIEFNLTDSELKIKLKL